MKCKRKKSFCKYLPQIRMIVAYHFSTDFVRNSQSDRPFLDWMRFMDSNKSRLHERKGNSISTYKVQFKDIKDLGYQTFIIL